jgi:thiol:disulfide interchange protein DsbD
MVVTYDVVGVALILTHRATGTLLGNPWVITPIALLFVVLALPMFGVFELVLPASLQARLSDVGGPGRPGSFAMGLVAGVLAAPCSGPVTALIAGVVSQSGSLGLGTLLMTVYATGIGTLFFVLAAFSVKLPRSGAWMDVVKSIFGIALVTLALLYLKDAFPFARGLLTRLGQSLIPMAPVAAALAAFGVLLGALHRSFHDAGMEKILKVTGIAFAVLGIFLRLGVNTPVAMADGPHRPLPGIEAAAFVGLDEGLKASAAQHKPMLIDFGAEWCAACKELEKVTYPAPEVKAEMKRFVAVKVDGTNDDDATEALYLKYGVSGLPTVVFFDSAGKAMNEAKLTGFEEPAKFLARLKKVP